MCKPLHSNRQVLQDLLGTLEVSLFGSSDLSPKIKLDSMAAILHQRLAEVEKKYAMYSALNVDEKDEVMHTFTHAYMQILHGIQIFHA
jgi:hypothetical protein